MRKLKNILSKEIFLYVAAVILCGIFLYFVLQLWAADFRVPFDYHWDALDGGTSIKGMIANGWPTSNQSIGAPYGFSNYDFSSNANIDMVIMKAISLVFPNWALTMNIYFLLTFPLITISALFVLRKLKISRLTSVVGSLLFTFIPFHFLQGELHLSLAAYYLIPLAVLLCLWLFEDGFSLKLFKASGTNSPGKSLNWKSIGSILICIGMGVTFIYYPFFTCFFLLIAGAGAAVSRKKWQPLFNSFILIAIIILLVIAFNIPSLLYQHQNGTNQLITRNPAGSEVWGLKIIQLILPVSGNHNPILAAFADKYNYSAPFVNENQSAALGIIGSIGFIVLIVWVFYRLFRTSAISQQETLKKINQISILNIAAVILGTVGGLGAIVAFTFFPEIRTYTRISIFIAFFSISAIALLLDYLIRKTTFSKWVVLVIMVGVLVVGINDQTSTKFVPDYQGIKAEFMSDEHFVQNIEKTYPADNMVFQLPYVPYPEGTLSYHMSDYDLFRGYLHSTDIHWSYGTMKGRYGDYWQSNIAGKPVAEMVRELSFAGFNGIYVDTNGYADSGKEVMASLSSMLDVTPLKSDNGRLYFFDMAPYNAQLTSQFTAAEYEQQKTEALYPIYIEFRGGFLPMEGNQDNNIRFCTSQGELVITNFTDKDKTITIDATFETGYDALSLLKIESSLVTKTLVVNGAGNHYVKELTVPPGKHTIKISCDAQGDYFPRFQKDIVFGVLNFKTTEK